MTLSVDLAVVGCASLAGEALIELLAASDLPMGQLYLLDSEEAAGGKIEFRGRYLAVRSWTDFDFSKVRLALLAVPRHLAVEAAPRIAAQGCSVIDIGGHSWPNSDTALMVAGVNSERLPLLPAGSIIASPSPASVLLALVLEPLRQAAGLGRVDATICYPASSAGRAGVEELATQTARLLNTQSITPRVFPKQLAFNLLPQVGQLLPDGSSCTEAAIATELRQLLDPALDIGISAIQAPVFYGLSLIVHLQTERPLSAAAARALLAAAPGIKVVDDAAESGFPTPVTEAASENEVFVGRLRDDGSRAQSLNFCIVADNVRKGAAINGIQLAERLVRGDKQQPPPE